MNPSTFGLPFALRSLRLLPCASFGLLAGCYGSDFTPTASGYAPTARPPESVQITSEHPGPGFAEVGLLTGTGGSFEGAIKRIKREAADRGCDVVYIQGEALQSGYGTPGAAYGMTKSHVRAACFVAAPGAQTAVAASSPPPAAIPVPVPAAQTAPAACAPDCRQGYDCVQGSCVPACNPACPGGAVCMGHGSNAVCAPPPAAN